MVEGAHYVEFTLLKQGRYGAYVGVAGAGFDAPGRRRQVHNCGRGWVLYTGNGALWHADRPSDWEGMPRAHEVKVGDVVGLLLDLEQRTLSVYLNGSRCGMMVAPGMKNTDGDVVGELRAPLVWAVDLAYGSSVRIERKPLASSRILTAAATSAPPRGALAAQPLSQPRGALLYVGAGVWI